MQRPFLLVDIDGVTEPMGSRRLPGWLHRDRFFAQDDEPVRLAHIHGRWLREISRLKF